MQLNFAIGKNNTQIIRFKDDTSGQMAVTDLSSVSRFVWEIGENTVIDSDTYPTCFDATLGDGKLELNITGVPDLLVGSFRSYITLYDPSNPNGVTWLPSFKVKLI